MTPLSGSAYQILSNKGHRWGKEGTVLIWLKPGYKNDRVVGAGDGEAQTRSRGLLPT